MLDVDANQQRLRAEHGGSGLDSREPKPPVRPRDLYEPDLHIDTLKVRARNFR